MKRTAIVAGATGLVGSALLRKLLDDPGYERVAALIRRPTGIAHPKLKEIAADFDRLELTSVSFEAADVYCALGTTIKKAGSQQAFRRVDYGFPLALAKKAKEDGAARFLIVTAMGANAASRIFYNRVKGETEESLRSLGLPALDLFRPSLLLGKRAEFRLGERVGAAVSAVLSPLLIGPLRQYRPIQAETVADAMIRAAKSDGGGPRIFESDRIAAIAAGSEAAAVMRR